MTEENFEIKHNADATAIDLKALVAQALDAVHKTIEDLATQLSAQAPEAVAALKEAGLSARDNIGGVAGRAGDLGGSRIADLSAAVRRNPLTWLTVAAGVGLIIGLWNNRSGQR